MGRSLGFGSTRCYLSPYSDSVSLRLRYFGTLTSQHQVTRRSILQKVRGQALRQQADVIALPLLVGRRFQVLFHYPHGVLFTFPSRYLFTIGRQIVFSLGWWSTRFPTGFHVSRGTQEDGRKDLNLFSYRTITFFGRPFQCLSLKMRFCNFARSLVRPENRPLLHPCSNGTSL